MTNPVRPADPGKPWLATKAVWTTDYSQVVLTVRDGVKWSDGQAFTADDIAYTFTLMQKNAALNQQRPEHQRRRPSAGNTATMTFPTSQFVNQTKMLQPFIVPQAHLVEDGRPDDRHRPEAGRYGPVHAEVVHAADDRARRAHDGYWQTLPKVKELRYTSYSGNDTQTTALANGESEWSFVFIPNAKTIYPRRTRPLQALVPADAGHPRPVVQHHEGAAQRRDPAPRDRHGDQPGRHLQPGRVRLLLPARSPTSPASRRRPARRSSPRSTRTRTSPSMSRVRRRC